MKRLAHIAWSARYLIVRLMRWAEDRRMDSAWQRVCADGDAELYVRIRLAQYRRRNG